ncbi:MAG TPA: hypothetical protein VFJ58_11670 [Armatimonadota bacterium]|nr:hypothetical protein [Armatimonadota bacterium]
MTRRPLQTHAQSSGHALALTNRCCPQLFYIRFHSALFFAYVASAGSVALASPPVCNRGADRAQIATLRPRGRLF